jgi:hypothetical protein
MLPSQAANQDGPDPCRITVIPQQQWQGQQGDQATDGDVGQAASRCFFPEADLRRQWEHDHAQHHLHKRLALPSLGRICSGCVSIIPPAVRHQLAPVTSMY